MGQEILYCYKCQRRIVGSDFAKGQAYQVGNHVSCAACAADLLPQLAPQERERLLGQMFKATQSRGQKSAPHVPVDRTPPPVAHVVPAAPARGPSPAIWLGLVVAVAVVVIGIVALSAGNKAEPERPEPVSKPRVVGSSPAPRESSDETRRQEAAQAAIRKARDVAKARPDDLEGQIKAWQEAVWASDKTSSSEEAKRELDGQMARRRDLVAKALADLEAQASPKLAAEEFKAASLLYEAARPRFAAVEWTGMIDAKVREIHDRAVAAAAALRAKAVAAQERRSTAEAKILVERVARWGYPDVELEFRRAVEAAVPAGPATPGLVAQWPLGEGKGTTTADTTGRWTGQLKGSAGWLKTASGSALRLDGSGAHVLLPNSPELDRLQSESYTIAIWYKPEAIPPVSTERDLGGAWALVMKAPLREGLLYYGGGKFMLVHWLAGPKWGSAASWGDSFPPGAWYHVAGVVDRAAGQNRIYVDGVLKGTENWPKNNPAQDFGSERWAIGKVDYNGRDTYFAQGAFSDLRLYDRALDVPDLKPLHSAGPPSGK